MFELTDKIALVTGAGSGIGQAIAERFGKAGAFVWVVDLDTDRGQATARGIQQEGGRAEFAAADVRHGEACRNLARTIQGRHGQLDVLVNNAGIGHVGTIQQTDEADFDRMYEVNVRGVFNMSRAFIDAMIERRSGSIINMASVGGVVGIRDRLAYTSTKFGVVGLTKAMALDHAQAQVRVNCICPGRVETPFVQARLQEYDDPQEAYRQMSATQALGRMGKPEEIAAAAHYLASDDAAFVTGSAMLIDGGFSAGK